MLRSRGATLGQHTVRVCRRLSLLEVSAWGQSLRAESFGLSSYLPLSLLQIGILKGYMETQGPEKTGERSTTYGTPPCAVHYSKIFKQVSGLELVPGAGRSAGRHGEGPRPPGVSRFKGQSAQVEG